MVRVLRLRMHLKAQPHSLARILQNWWMDPGSVKAARRTKGVDNEREHIAAVGVQRPIRIDAGLDQFSAKRQDRRSTVRGVAFGGADVRADELGADGNLRFSVTTVSS